MAAAHRLHFSCDSNAKCKQTEGEMLHFLFQSSFFTCCAEYLEQARFCQKKAWCLQDAISICDGTWAGSLTEQTSLIIVTALIMKENGYWHRNCLTCTLTPQSYGEERRMHRAKEGQESCNKR